MSNHYLTGNTLQEHISRCSIYIQLHTKLYKLVYTILLHIASGIYIIYLSDIDMDSLGLNIFHQHISD